MENLMKTLAKIALLLVLLLSISTGNPSWAADLGNGAKIFSAKCASCHMGGKNVVNPAKTLQKADLEKYAMNDLDAIKTQVTNGKAAMPAFKGQLSDADIEDVASYVLEQSTKGWTGK
jgi:cytochrome c6